MPSFSIGDYEIEGEEDVQELLDALQETDERLRLSANWSLIRAITERLIESGDFRFQNISAGQFAVLATTVLFRILANDDAEAGGDDYGMGGDIGEVLLNPRACCKQFERLFLEEMDVDPDDFDESGVAEFTKELYSSASNAEDK